MLTRFEQFAVNEMMSKPDTPPRANGTLCFANDWERTAFGVALTLARNGYFEWDDFRDELITQIGTWEAEHPIDRSSWNYYERWLAALEKAVVKSGLLDPAELSAALSASPAEPHAA